VAVAADLFRRVAVPRVVGSPGAQAVRAIIETELRAIGYTVSPQRFSASAARVYAVSVLGAGLGWGALVLCPLLVLPLSGWIVALLGVTGLALIALTAHGIAEGRLPASSPPVNAVNLEAQRERPKLWLVAHADSKSQRISLRGRVCWVIVWGIAVTALAISLVVRVTGPLPWWWVLSVTVLAVASGAVLSASTVGNASPGAVDNATGIIALLAAARALGDRRDVGVLITDAEEFAMVGTRAWCAAGRRTGAFVNFDGIDSRGSYRVVLHARDRRGRRQGGPARTIASSVVDALQGAGWRAHIGPLPPGVLVDGAVLAGAGMTGITVSRGDWTTLGVVHTLRDVPGRVAIESVVVAGGAVAQAVHQWLVDEASSAA
jgi:hypothetical protein